MSIHDSGGERQLLIDVAADESATWAVVMPASSTSEFVPEASVTSSKP